MRYSLRHRRVKSFGLHGGEADELGRTCVRRKSGTIEGLKDADQTDLDVGEAITVITPTGGGYGPKEKRQS